MGGFEELEYQSVIVSAQVFEEEACSRVEHDVECEGLSFGVVCGTEDQEQGEDDKIQLSFPNFRWPQGLVAIREERESAFRIEYSKGRACRSTESVPVHEIGATTNSLPVLCETDYNHVIGSVSRVIPHDPRASQARDG